MRLGSTAFDLDQTPVTWADVLARGYLGRRLEPLVAALAESVGAMELAANEGFQQDTAAVKAAMNAWRTSRRQASSDETRAWLEARGLTLDDLVNWVQRTQQRELFRTRDTIPVPEIRSLPFLAHELEFAGRDESLVLEIANEAVVPPAEKKALEIERAKLVAAFARVGTPEAIAAALGVPADSVLHAFEHAANYRLAREKILTPAALDEQLARDRRMLARVEVAAARFDSESMALEAAACLRDEKKWLEVLAGEMGFESSRETWFVEDMPPSSLNTQLATGRPGDVFGPFQKDGGFFVYEVLTRIEPNLTDPEVRHRVETRVLTRALQLEVQRRVRVRLVG